MKTRAHILFGLLAVACIAPVPAQEERKSSYAPVVPNEALAVTMSRMKSLLSR